MFSSRLAQRSLSSLSVSASQSDSFRRTLFSFNNSKYPRSVREWHDRLEDNAGKGMWIMAAIVPGILMYCYGNPIDLRQPHPLVEKPIPVVIQWQGKPEERPKY